jgi:ectoine hydroxylase-related dioxygenase (phytanoyl-CoA dioxygenase family)
MTCWTAIDPTGTDNGCVEYLSGSHHERLPHRETGQQQALDIDPSAVDTSRVVPVLLAAGEAVIHHGLTAHRSAANASAKPRLGIATLYVREHVPVTRDDFPYAPF